MVTLATNLPAADASAAPEAASTAQPVLEDATHPAGHRAQEQHWQRSYRNRVRALDAIAITVAVAIAQFVRFGIPQPTDPAEMMAWNNVTIFSAAIAVMWFTLLGLQKSRDVSLVGIGIEEYRRVILATAWVFGVVATTGLLTQQQMARGYLVIALPLGLFGLLVGRHLLRRHLARKRSRGEFNTRLLVLGKPESIESLCGCLARVPSAGYSVVGACIPGFTGETGTGVPTSAGVVPVLGDENAVEQAIVLTRADALAVTVVEQLGQERVRRLAWRLDELHVDMIVVPGMTDVAGPRLKIRPIDNLPLFHVARPRHETPSIYGKRIFDVVFGTAALLLVMPVMVLAALAIKLEDGGPAFFRQERVGHRAKHFRIVKFRTMVTDAESVKDTERTNTGQADSVFYKSASDSRITRIGRFLRKTSIDELPQLFNVLAGTMSIVGPRPLIPGEGGTVEQFVERRALVKPGMTGLWQVSGRSDVSAEERIRLDHSYVDNWSCVLDLVIVWRTLRVVLKREGAY